MTMKKPIAIPLVKNALLTLAEIKAAVESFDNGDTNAFDALDAIVIAVDAYRSAAQPRSDAA